MTVLEAERIYDFEVKCCIKAHRMKIEKAIRICFIISLTFLAISAILLIIGYSLPTEIDYFGDEQDSAEAFTLKLFGLLLLPPGVVFLLILIPSLRSGQKKGPANLLPQIKNLYLNYLQCVDMTKDEKLYYIQKLEEIRNAELACAIRGASANVSAAILFSTLR